MNSGRAPNGVRLDSRGLKTFLPLLLCLGATDALAQSLEVLGPSGVVPPDGFAVAVRLRGADGKALPANPRLAVESAEVQPGPPQPPLRTLWVTPRPGAREVRLRASEGSLSAEGRFPVGPPSARVELSINPPAPVKGRDTKAALTIRVLRTDGTPDPDASPPVVRTNVGTVTGLVSAGPGLFHATYELPSTRYPEVAIIVALSPWPGPSSIEGALGRLLVPLSGSVDLPGRTEPEAEMTLEIAGVTFGPVKAGTDGRFSLPVVVPPGHRFGIGTAVDKAGNKRKSRVDLALPPTDQLACVANPTRLPADGAAQARILCAASDPFGKPVASRSVQLTTQRGRLTDPQVREDAMIEWIYTAPRSQPGEPDTLLATWRQGGPRSREELKLDLVQGPAARLELSAREKLVHAGGELHLEAVVTDALGRPRPGATLRVAAPAGSFSKPEEVAPGRFSFTWRVPEDLRGTPTLRAKAQGPVGAEPAHLSAWIEGGQLRAAVTDPAGLPVRGQPLLAGERSLVTGDDGEAVVGPAAPGRVTISHRQWPGLRVDAYVLDGARDVFPASAPPGTPERAVTVPVAPPAKVIVRFAQRPGVVLWWLEDDKGRRLEGRRVEVVTSAEPRGAQAMSAREPLPVLIRGKLPQTVTVTDVDANTTGVLEVKP